MKKFLLLALAGVALLPVTAFAADMGAPVYKAAPPPPPPPVPIWTGCYGNAGAGYGMYNQDHQTIEDGVTASQDTTTGGRGWLGLVGVGCDYQFSTGAWGNWVVGAFGDYDFMDLKGNIAAAGGEYTGSERENSAWAIGARIGYLVTPAILVYWNGGYTSTRFGGVNLSPTIVLGGPPPGSYSLGAQTFDGGFIGGGTEIAVQAWPGLFWRSEYRYSSYRSANVQFFEDGVAIPDFEHETKAVQTITSSLVWKFNWGR